MEEYDWSVEMTRPDLNEVNNVDNGKRTWRQRFLLYAVVENLGWRCLRVSLGMP
jgi:hypothetical protein